MTVNNTPSFSEETGLHIAITQPIWFTAASRVGLFNPNARLVGYAHEKLANGGEWSANITLTMPLTEAEDWIENGIGRHIEVYNQSDVKIFCGFANKIIINAAGLSLSVGPLMDVANYVYGIYTPLLNAIYPPSHGTTSITAIYQNTGSQTLYSRIEKILDIGTAVDGDAVAAIQTYLSEIDKPKFTGDININAGGVNNATLEIECLGYIHTLKNYIYRQTSTATVTAYAKIRDILLSDPNNILVQDFDFSIAVGPNVQYVEAQDRSAFDVIMSIVSLGDAAYNRMIFQVNDRNAEYRSIPTTVKYIHMITDQGQRILDAGTRQVVYPWDIVAGEYIAIHDFLTGVEPTVTVDDPRNKFIESVKYTAPWTIGIQGGRTDKFTQMMARITMSGGR